MKTLILVLLLLSVGPASAIAAENRLNPFESDGCSMVPDSDPIQGNDWLNCCIPHDINYWKGGTAQEKETTDMNFKICLEKNKMSKFVSQLFYYGVAIGGTPSLQSTWRWGYGWETSRGYAPLTSKENKQIAEYENLKGLPVFIREPQFTEAFKDAVTWNNNCKKDMIKKVENYMSFKGDPKLIKIHNVESKGGDRYQLFSPECKGGYIVIDFHYTLSPDLCGFSDYYYNLAERIKSFLVYGTCKEFIKK